MPYPFNQMGNTFLAYLKRITIPNTTTVYPAILITPDSDTMTVHLANMRNSISGAGTGYIRIFILENPAYQLQGVQPQMLGNTDRRSGRAPTTTVERNVINIVGGTEIYRTRAVARKPSDVPIFFPDGMEFILRKNSAYVIGVENQSGADIDSNMQFTFYEDMSEEQ